MRTSCISSSTAFLWGAESHCAPHIMPPLMQGTVWLSKSSVSFWEGICGKPAAVSQVKARWPPARQRTPRRCDGPLGWGDFRGARTGCNPRRPIGTEGQVVECLVRRGKGPPKQGMRIDSEISNKAAVSNGVFRMFFFSRFLVFRLGGGGFAVFSFVSFLSNFSFVFPFFRHSPSFLCNSPSQVYYVCTMEGEALAGIDSFPCFLLWAWRTGLALVLPHGRYPLRIIEHS